jgi:hypothetical protein
VIVGLDHRAFLPSLGLLGHPHALSKVFGPSARRSGDKSFNNDVVIYDCLPILFARRGKRIKKAHPPSPTTTTQETQHRPGLLSFNGGGFFTAQLARTLLLALSPLDRPQAIRDAATAVAAQQADAAATALREHVSATLVGPVSGATKPPPCSGGTPQQTRWLLYDAK